MLGHKAQRILKRRIKATRRNLRRPDGPGKDDALVRVRFRGQRARRGRRATRRMLRIVFRTMDVRSTAVTVPIAKSCLTGRWLPGTGPAHRAANRW